MPDEKEKIPDELSEKPNEEISESEIESGFDAKKKKKLIRNTIISLLALTLIGGTVSILTIKGNAHGENKITTTTKSEKSSPSAQKKLNLDYYEYDQAIKVNPITVIDGNHIVVKLDGHKTTVRLLLTNAPSLDQENGKEAKEILKNEISGLRYLYLKFDKQFGKIVNGEVTAYVLTDSVNNYLEYVLLGKGLAEIKINPDNESNQHYQDFLSMQEASKSEGLGLWSDK